MLFISGHNLTSRSLEVGVPMVMLQHYVNQTLHLLVCPAIVTLALQHSVTQGHARRGKFFGFLQGRGGSGLWSCCMKR
jgi:hypothetical protein